MLKWFSVKDKLPEPSEEHSVVLCPWVLAYCPEDEEIPYVIAAYGLDEAWYDCEGYMLSDDEVTHWMYLYEPGECK